MRLSGPAGEGPAAAAGASSAAQALAAGDESQAVHRYLEAYRQDPFVELPDPRQQLAISYKLASHGYPHLAKAALERFLKSHPLHDLAPHALLLLGYVERSFFKALPTALKHFEAVAAHPAADPQDRQDAAARIKEARAFLDRNIVDPAARQDPCALLFESVPPLTQAQLSAAGEILGRRPDRTNPGFLGWNVPAADAVRAAERLERAGVPAVVVPMARLIRLGEPAEVQDVAWDARGLALKRPSAADVSLAWGECLLLAAVAFKRPGVAPGRVVPGGAGRSPLAGGGVPQEVVETQWSELCLEVVALDGRWWRRSFKTKAEQDGFLPMVRAILVEAANVPVESGAAGAFAGALPAACVFADAGDAQMYLSWQAQLARLKRQQAYG
ncbi:MAG: hypothetical protein HY927_11585 [Elusimicrobia bacterium]|nr:hypothetical protein [Elusimicrobiota bacterium]